MPAYCVPAQMSWNWFSAALMIQLESGCEPEQILSTLLQFATILAQSYCLIRDSTHLLPNNNIVLMIIMPVGMQTTMLLHALLWYPISSSPKCINILNFDHMTNVYSIINLVIYAFGRGFCFTPAPPSKLPWCYIMFGIALSILNNNLARAVAYELRSEFITKTISLSPGLLTYTHTNSMLFV